MLELQNVSSGYGKKQVLQQLSAVLEKGKLTGIIGPNGCGKSTLLKTAMGMLPLMKGQVTLLGRSVDTIPPREIAKKIAYLAQGKAVPDMTVAQMVLHGRFPHLSYPRRYSQTDREIAYAAMEQMKIAYLADQPLSSLSGGMRQNAYIAMALAQDTDFILLDEPTTYLDIANRFQLMALLRSLADRGKGIAAVLHDLPLAMSYADTLVVMQEGRAVMSGTPEAVYRSGILSQVFGVELQRAGDTYYFERHREER